MSDRVFPTMGPHAIEIPWDVIAPHEAQAKSNHGGQTLERLAERGGLSPDEACAVLEDRPWCKMHFGDALSQLTSLVRDFKNTCSYCGHQQNSSLCQRSHP